jgi:pullulanase
MSMRRFFALAVLCPTLTLAQAPISTDLPHNLGAMAGSPMLSVAAQTDGAQTRTPGLPAVPTEALQNISNDFLKLQAYWIDRTTILIPSAHLEANGTYRLSSDPDGRLALSPNGVMGGTSVKLAAAGGAMTASQLGRFPQLASGYAVLRLPADIAPSQERAFLTGQLAISVQNASGTLCYATGVQDAGALDDLYAYAGRLGVIVEHPQAHQEDGSHAGSAEVKIKVWAPTALTMRLQLFLAAEQTAPSRTIAMHEDRGVWTAVLDPQWISHYYLFDEAVYSPTKRAVVENIVSDPYSIDLALNGSKSRITDMDAKSNKPKGWDEDRAPALERINDLSIYELHVRDFSIADQTVPVDHRGTYLAFTDSSSDGMRHLRALAGDGLKAVHLLPTFHFNSVNEDKSSWSTTADLAQFPPDGLEQQAAVSAIKATDGYNWGYAPIHYLAPEGAYAVDPNERVREYRSMVMALHRSGLRVIQDVVFNHTSGFGDSPNSVLDKIVPNYYHRLDSNGDLLTKSCCADTASEHIMMGKLQQDAILWNAKHYKIDGFRFDLMEFTFIKNLREIRDALSKLTLANDGVDGSKIYLYGEGWEMGETAHNALGINATQLNLYGTGVGSFNDRMRDAIRGGHATGDPQVQGFATGLFTSPNSDAAHHASRVEQQTSLLHEEDWIRIGLAGNLRDLRFTDAAGETVTASQVDYNGRPAGYTASPIEAINYVSVHDGQALFDAIQLKSPEGDTAATRARRQVLAMSLVELGQGIPFFMAGDDLLRSKDMDTDSYDSGDWFNKIDWSGESNNWGIGLPLAGKNRDQYAVEKSLLANASLKPDPATIRLTAKMFAEFLRIRYSSRLFRMSTLQEVQDHLHFLNTGTDQIPGVLVMELDSADSTYGPYQHVLVVSNATTSEQRISSASLEGLDLQLHPIQLDSSDPLVRRAMFISPTGTAEVPALTTAVFVSAQ